MSFVIDLDEYAEGAILLDGLEDAIIGIVEEFGNGTLSQLARQAPGMQAISLLRFLHCRILISQNEFVQSESRKRQMSKRRIVRCRTHASSTLERYCAIRSVENSSGCIAVDGWQGTGLPCRCNLDAGL
jgi:hypothetical protein